MIIQNHSFLAGHCCAAVEFVGHCSQEKDAKRRTETKIESGDGGHVAAAAEGLAVEERKLSTWAEISAEWQENANFQSVGARTSYLPKITKAFPCQLSFLSPGSQASLSFRLDDSLWSQSLS